MTLSEQSKKDIQSLYSDWLSEKRFRPRRAQREMIAHVANTIGRIESDTEGLRDQNYQDHLCLIEAGTGTGKTLAYLIPSLVLAKELDKTLVISTATVALQEQLAYKDIPEFLSQSSVHASFEIAKGRSRYLCYHKLHTRLEGFSSGEEATLFPDEEIDVSEETVAALKQLENSYQKTWEGDRDSLEEPIESAEWALVAADRASCTGRKCAYYKNCALFEARERVREADLVVVNHDLLLADMSLGGNVLPDAAETILVIDEAHHLPDKARSHSARRLFISAAKQRFAACKRAFTRLKLAKTDIEIRTYEKNIFFSDDTVLSLLDHLNFSLLELIDSAPQKEDRFDSNVRSYRFELGVVPDVLSQVYAELSDCLVLKLSHLEKLLTQLAAKVEDNSEGDSAILSSVFTELSEVNLGLQNDLDVCQSFAQANRKPETAGYSPHARWLEVEGDEVVVFDTPLSSASILETTIWQQVYAAILTSATLAPMGDFSYYLRQLRDGNVTNLNRLVGQLKFDESIFYVPKLGCDPSAAEEHSREIIRRLPAMIEEYEGGQLVLFSSNRQMNEVYEGLPEELRTVVFRQGDMSKQRIIKEHKARVDNGEKSIVFGLASFAEGIDLPGKYCAQVFIAKIPFSVPDRPEDVSMGEWVESNGGNAFRDLSLPSAAVRLMQAAGRLLRSDEDTGRVVLFDSRIKTKFYGKNLLKSLPPFQFVIE